MEHMEQHANRRDRGGYFCVIDTPLSNLQYSEYDQSALLDVRGMYCGLTGIHT
jgi:hypothetical protein